MRGRGNNIGGAAIQLNTGYGANTPHLPPTNRTGTPIFRNLLFEDCDFILGDLGYATTFSGLKEAPATNITFKNVNFYPPGKNPAWPKPRPVPGEKGVLWGPCDNVVGGACEGGTSLESCPPCFTMRNDTQQMDWLAKRAALVNAVFGESVS